MPSRYNGRSYYALSRPGGKQIRRWNLVGHQARPALSLVNEQTSPQTAMNKTQTAFQFSAERLAKIAGWGRIHVTRANAETQNTSENISAKNENPVSGVGDSGRVSENGIGPTLVMYGWKALEARSGVLAPGRSTGSGIEHSGTKEAWWIGCISESLRKAGNWAVGLTGVTTENVFPRNWATKNASTSSGVVS